MAWFPAVIFSWESAKHCSGFTTSFAWCIFRAPPDITNPSRARMPEAKSEARDEQDAATQSQRAGKLASDAFDPAVVGDVPERQPGRPGHRAHRGADFLRQIAGGAMPARGQFRDILPAIRSRVRPSGGDRV